MSRRRQSTRVIELAMESSLSVAAVNHILRSPDRAAAEVLARLVAAAERIDFPLPDTITAQPHQNGIRST